MTTRYSKCKCGETAFDWDYKNVFENGRNVIRGQYRCRNCQRLLKTTLNESQAHLYNFETGKEVIL